MLTREELLTNLTPERARTRPVTITGILLLCEAVAFLGYAIYRINQVNWHQELRLYETISQAAADTFFLGVLLAALALTATLGGIGVLLVRPLGWLLAMITQGIGLLICLLLYFQRNVDYVYPVMGLCIMMVLYLNSFDVRVLFTDSPFPTPEGDQE